MNPNRRSGRPARRSAEPAPTPSYLRYAVFLLALTALAGCSEPDAIVAPKVGAPHLTQDMLNPVVNSLADPGDGTCDDAGTGDGCTLREAIAFATTNLGLAAPITFDPALTSAGPQVIALVDQLSIQKTTTIIGPGANVLTVRRAPDAATDFGLIDIRGRVAVEIRGLTIAGGRGGYGIAAFFTETEITLRNVVMSDNGSGAIYTASQMTIDSSTISDNQAPGSNGKGAGIYVANGNLTVTNSTISGNAAGSLGGGIFQNGGGVQLMNVTVAGNSAPIGGGFGKEAGQALFIHVTLAGNSASTYSGIYSLTDRPNVLLVNTIVANNNGDRTQCGSFGTPAIADGGGNLVYPAANACAGITPATTGDPKLGALALNAPGVTATMALGAGSAAIDAAQIQVCPTHDQRGVARPQRGGCDIGAYEAEPSSDVTPPVITPNISGTLGSNGWYTSDVTVSWSVNDEESAVTSAACAPTTISADTPSQDVACSATSAGGTSSERVAIKRDATPPSLSPAVAPNPVFLKGSAAAAPNATDALSGVASSSCGTPNTATVGSKSVSCSATDNAGNSATAGAAYSVAYRFIGFSGNVLGGGALNLAKAGQNIPLKWRLLDAAGAPVTNLTSATVAVANLACAGGTTAGALAAAATGGSALQNLGGGYYQFNWATPKAYANTCKTMQLNLGEGTTHNALFRFTK